MKTKFKVLAVIVVMMLAVVSTNAFSANVRSTMGNKDDATNTYTLEEKSDNVVYVRPTGGIRYPYEKKTTNDTITLQETGSTYSIDPATQVTLTLPDAAVGMEFTFVAVDGHYNGSQKIILDPQSTDIFRGVLNSSSASTFSVGDSVISPGVTGDTIQVKCNEDTFWDVTSIRGAWADNN